MAKPNPKSQYVSPDPGLETFRGISQELTGYTEAELEATGMLDDYYRTLMKEQDHEGVRSFFLQAEKILNLNDKQARRQEIQNAFIDFPDSIIDLNPQFDEMKYEGLAQRIVLLWYLGVWTTMNWKQEQSQQARTAIVSPQAYQAGLIWETAETHPSGAKQPGFGSWSQPPVGAVH